MKTHIFRVHIDYRAEWITLFAKYSHTFASERIRFWAFIITKPRFVMLSFRLCLVKIWLSQLQSSSNPAPSYFRSKRHFYLAYFSSTSPRGTYLTSSSSSLSLILSYFPGASPREDMTHSHPISVAPRPIKCSPPLRLWKHTLLGLYHH